MHFPLAHRPSAQIGAWVSDQSEPVGSREELDAKAKGIEVRLEYRRRFVDNQFVARGCI